MDTIAKTAAVCVSAALLAVVIKKDSPAMALLLTLGAACFAAYFAVTALKDVTAAAAELATGAGMDGPVLSAVLKTAGIGITAAFASDVCEEAGMKAASSAVDLAGGAAAVAAAFPLVKTVVTMLGDLL